MQKDRAARALDPLGMNQISSPLILLPKGTLIGLENNSVLLYIITCNFFFYKTLLCQLLHEYLRFIVLNMKKQSRHRLLCNASVWSYHMILSSRWGLPSCHGSADVHIFMYLFISTFVDDDHVFQVSVQRVRDNPNPPHWDFKVKVLIMQNTLSVLKYIIHYHSLH